MAGGKHGGAEAFFVRLAQAFHGHPDIDQRVLVRRDGVWGDPLCKFGVDVVELPFGGLLDFRSKRLFQRQIDEFKPDIVLTWMNRATKYCPKPSRATPFIHAARLGGYYDLKNYRNCNHLICNTHDIVSYVVGKGWSPQAAHYLPNFVSSEKSLAVSRDAHDTPADVPLVAALGRLHTNKAFDVLLQAIDKVPGACLWIAGEGPERGNLEQLAARLGIADRVRFLGWQDDAAAIYAACDVFVCPSRHEPLGNVVIEAWAQERVVVATRSAGPAALIAHEETGLLSDVDDPARLAVSLNRAINDAELRTRMIARGRAAYEAEFTEAAVVDHYLAFFNSVAEAR
jgi:glycosyltransferase involved in cell wall biosynthesis